MKKRKIILMILALLLILGLSSCNKKNPGNVLNEQFIKDNIEDNDYNDDSIIDYSNVSVNAKSFDYDRIIKSYSNLGLVVVENNYSRVGFYSLQYNKYIVNPRFVNEWLTYEVNTSSYVDYVLTIDYDCHTYIYDSLGNELYNGEEDDISVSHTMVNGILYCTLTYNDSYYPEYSYFKYNKNGSVQSVSSIEYYKYDDEDEDEITEFPFGTLYFDMVSLSEFGLDYYISLNNNLLTVYNSNKIYKFTTHIPSEIEGVAVITNKLYYQVTNILPDDSNEYDYSIANAKYSLTTYSLSLSDGTQKKEKLDYIILDSKPYNKKSSVEKFSHLKIQRIDDERTLGFVEEYIVDSNGNFRDDVTNMELESFIAVGDNLYNTKTKILYNSQLKVISYLNNINPVYYEEGYFIGNLNGSYGILDTNGLVVCEFIYDSITPTFVNDCVIGYKNGEYYRINLNYNDHDLLGKYNEVTKINNYLYIVEGESYYYFEGIDEEISRQYKSYNCTYSFSYKTLSSLYSKDNICVTVTSKYADTLDYNEIRYYLFKYNEYPNDSSFTSHGDTNSSYPAYGTSVDDAINLNVEEENYYYYLSGQNKFVYSFTPQNIGYYTIDSCYGELSISVVDSEGNQISLNYNYDYTYTALLEKGKTYYYSIGAKYSTYNKDCYKFTFIKEKGFNQSYPALYDDPISVDFGLNTYLYMLYTCEEDGYYNITTPSSYTMTIQDYNGYSVYSDSNGFLLHEGNSYYLEFNKIGYNNSFVADISYASYQPIGASKDTAKEIPTLQSSKHQYDNFYDNNSYYYYSYTNNTSYSQLVTVHFDNYNRYMQYLVYNSNNEVIYSINGSDESYSSSHLVLKDETIYFKVSIPYLTSISAYVDVKKSTSSDYNLFLDSTYSAYLLKVYKFNSSQISSGYNEINCTSVDGLVTFYLYDKNFKALEYNGTNYVLAPNYSGNIYVVTYAAVYDTFKVSAKQTDLISISNNSTYSFNTTLSNDNKGPHSFTSTNKADSSSSTISFTALANIVITFEYKVSSESGYDYFKIYKNSTNVNSYSGLQTSYTSYTINLDEGDILKFTYSKDSSQSKGDDCVYIRNFKAQLR